MKVKCVLFDTDGVVVVSEQFSDQYQKEFKISESEMAPFFKGIFQECMVGKADLKVALEPYLKKWKWAGDAESLAQWWFKSEHHVDKNVVRLISELKKQRIRCCLATNQEKYRTEYMRVQMRFNTLLTIFFLRRKLGIKNHQKNFLRKFLKDYQHGISTRKIKYYLSIIQQRMSRLLTILGFRRICI